jgi:hypothetical protein
MYAEKGLENKIKWSKLGQRSCISQTAAVA